MSGSGPSAKFSRRAKKGLVIGVMQLAFLTLSSSYYHSLRNQHGCLSRRTKS